MKKISFGLILIILQVLAYIGSILTNNSIPIGNLFEFIGFNCLGIIGIILIIKQIKKDK